MKHIFLYSMCAFYLLGFNGVFAQNKYLYNSYQSENDSAIFEGFLTQWSDQEDNNDENAQDFINRANSKIGPSAMTYLLNGGRFGDNLLSYCRAKWASRMFDIPLLYVPFPYSNELALHENEKMYTQEEHKRFRRTLHLIKKHYPYVVLKNDNTLYVCRWKSSIVINWDDQTFLTEIKKNITPAHEIEKITPPEGMISVAVHVRNGGTFAGDTQQEKDRCPLRFVPEEFFIEHIHRVAQMFPEDMLYVYIFTDHPNPKELVHKFANALNNPRIIFDCRQEGNSHKSNVLEDFFSMMDFDCLIRPGSHFTRFVQRLGNNKMVIYPEGTKIVNGKRVIAKAQLKTRENSSKKWKTETLVTYV